MTNYDIKFCFNHSKHLAGLHNLFSHRWRFYCPHRRVNAASNNLMHIQAWPKKADELFAYQKVDWCDF